MTTSTLITPLAQRLLPLWFADMDTQGQMTEQNKLRWWQKNDAWDHQLRQKFEKDLINYPKITNQHNSAEDHLATIILLDQCSRNIYRNRAQMYAYDPHAVTLASAMIDAGTDKQLLPLQRIFVYLPYEHAEDLTLQNRCVALFSALAEDVPAAQQKEFNTYLNYAKQHHRIIEKFGRFPHRNTLLGRQSSTEEIAFLHTPNSSF